MRMPELFGGRRRLVFARLLGIGMAQGMLAVASAWLVMQLFSQFGSGAVVPGAALLGFIVVVLLSAWLRRSERVQAELLGQHYVRSVRRRLYARLLRSNPREFKRQLKGAILLKFVGDLSALRRWISLGLARLLVAGIVLAIALTAVGWLHWPFAIGIGAILSFTAILVLRIGSATRTAIAGARRQQARLAANVTEKLSHVVTVQAFGQESHERRVLRRQSADLLDASVCKAKYIGSLRAIIDAAAGACVVTVLAVAFLFPPDNLSAAMMAAVISIIGFLTPPLRDLGRAQEYWLAAQVARANLVAVTDRTPYLQSGRKGFNVTEGKVRFTKVRVGSSLRSVSGTAPGGSKIALLGANGSGKSTLLGLVGRLFDPDSGRVSIDGRDLRNARISRVRRQIAYVGADLPLLRGSLRKNLCYGMRRADSQHLERVLHACELMDFVARLPDGLDTRVSENGSDLSQGERMRLQLARALLRRPKILLLDEADANLDDAAIRVLEREIERFPGTVIMATHRKSVLRTCDQIWTLRNGRLEIRDNSTQQQRSDADNIYTMETETSSTTMRATCR